MNDGENGARSRRPILIAAGSILAAALALRLLRLGHFSYWLDEMLEELLARGSWERFWKSLKWDAVHPPLDYLVVRAVDLAHPVDWARKVPAVCWGIGAIAALGGLLVRRAGRREALLCMALLAVAPFHVRYSQELRPYSLGLFLLCLSLLCLERLLARPTVGRLLGLYAASLACAYALYLAAVVLPIAGGALIAEDCVSEDPVRRRIARLLAAWSPVFLVALWIGYLPWWRVLVEAVRRAPPVAPQPLSLARLGRTLSFFAFASNDGEPPGSGGLLYAGLVGLGLLEALRRASCRFLALWVILGFSSIEIMGHVHSHYYATRWFLPAGIALPALVSLPLARFSRSRAWPRAAGVALLAVLMALDMRGLASYYRSGRPDWRPLAAFLAREAKPDERIFAENQWTQICADFYLREESPPPGGKGPRVLPVEGDVRRLAYSWPSGSRAWLLLGGGPTSAALRTWAQPFPSFAFPTAEGTVVTRLDARAWGEAMRRVR